MGSTESSGGTDKESAYEITSDSIRPVPDSELEDLPATGDVVGADIVSENPTPDGTEDLPTGA